MAIFSHSNSNFPGGSAHNRPIRHSHKFSYMMVSWLWTVCIQQETTKSQPNKEWPWPEREAPSGHTGWFHIPTSRAQVMSERSQQHFGMFSVDFMSILICVLNSSTHIFKKRATGDYSGKKKKQRNSPGQIKDNWNNLSCPVKSMK